jgi:multisubunit Na+/H+ antiporter MnhF subunit
MTQIGSFFVGVSVAAFFIVFAVRILASPEYYYRLIDKTYPRRDRTKDRLLWQQARVVAAIVVILSLAFLYRFIVGPSR